MHWTMTDALTMLRAIRAAIGITIRIGLWLGMAWFVIWFITSALVR